MAKCGFVPDPTSCKNNQTSQSIIGRISTTNSDFQNTEFCAVRHQSLVRLFEHCSSKRPNAVFEIEFLQGEPMYRRLRTKRDVAMTFRVDDGIGPRFQ